MHARFFRTIMGQSVYEVTGSSSRNLVGGWFHALQTIGSATLHCSQCGYRCVPDEKPCAHMRAAISVATKGE